VLKVIILWFLCTFSFFKPLARFNDIVVIKCDVLA